jgi:hypothetical protein
VVSARRIGEDRRVSRVVACVLAIAAIAAAAFAVVAGVIAHARGIPDAPGALDAVPLLLGVGLPACVGAFLVLRRPRGVVGWILVVGALSVAGSMAASTASALLLDADRDSAPGAWLLLGSEEWLVFFAWPLALAYCYPDGRLPPRWRPAARLAVVSCGGVMLLLLLQQPLDGPFGPVDNPLGVDAKTPALLAVF